MLFIRTLHLRTGQKDSGAIGLCSTIAPHHSFHLNAAHQEHRKTLAIG